MKTPHKHAEIIKAWADGAQIQILNTANEWEYLANPFWCDHAKYRIKPEPKSDVVQFHRIEINKVDYQITKFQTRNDNLKLTFDGETGELKAAEVLK